MRETHEVVAAANRMIRAVGKRVAQEDPTSLAYLGLMEQRIDEARRMAIEGLRVTGYTDKDIGEALDMTRQAVQQRWPRSERVVGAGARWRRR